MISETRTRILTTHVGSLPRRPDVSEMMIARLDGRSVDARVYADALASSVSECVAWQAGLGLDIISDGEQSKPSFSDYVHERLGGLRKITGERPRRALTKEIAAFPEFYAAGHSGTRPPAAECVAALSYVGQDALQADLANLRRAVGAAEVVDAFVPSASVGTVEGAMLDSFYRDDDSRLEAIAEAMRVEYEAIVAAGFLLQIDDPRMAMTYMLNADMTVDEAKRWARRRVEAMNHALRNIPSNRVRHHTCYGINMGPRTHDLEMRHLVDIILSINADFYSFEFANPRHEHEWQIWQDAKLSAEKTLMPGVITHATVLVEHPDLVAQRIRTFADVVGRERVIASTDCGFASMLRAAPEVHPSIVEAKLSSLVEGARRATTALF